MSQDTFKMVFFKCKLLDNVLGANFFETKSRGKAKKCMQLLKQIPEKTKGETRHGKRGAQRILGYLGALTFAAHISSQFYKCPNEFT